MEKKFIINTIIYPEKIINQTINDFEEIWGINFNNWELVISWDNEEEITEIFNEFMNYSIWLINENI